MIIIGLIPQNLKAVEIKIKSEDEVIEFLVPKEMVAASSVDYLYFGLLFPQ